MYACMNIYECMCLRLRVIAYYKKFLDDILIVLTAYGNVVVENLIGSKYRCHS